MCVVKIEFPQWLTELRYLVDVLLDTRGLAGLVVAVPVLLGCKVLSRRLE